MNKQLINAIQPALAFNESRGDYKAWKRELKQTLAGLLGLESIRARAGDLNIKIEQECDFETYRRIRFTFESEAGNLVPCYLLIPKTAGKKPLAVCLQGHTKGFHISIGVQKFPGEEKNIQTRDFGLQAVLNGFAALCIEQRGMGETRAEQDLKEGGCIHSALAALLTGRTLIGERVFDISRAIDCMAHFDEIGADGIVCVGNSGGGTAAFYAGCCDERIQICAPSCAFSSYRDSIGSIRHCSCNYIPRALEFFDMGDLSALIAPRVFLPFAGELDDIFPLEGVKKQFEITKKIYAGENVAGRCALTVYKGEGHTFRADRVWPLINRHYKEGLKK